MKENFKASEINSIFHEYIDTCSETGTRGLRTEEAILISFGALYN
jgi:hypothetical protein